MSRIVFMFMSTVLATNTGCRTLLDILFPTEEPSVSDSQHAAIHRGKVGSERSDWDVAQAHTSVPKD